MRRIARIAGMATLIGGVGALALGGCVTPGTLDHSAARHEVRAARLAQLGDGEGAARERDLAVADREEAKLRARSRNHYLQSEVFLW
jgi:hypothetical protein